MATATAQSALAQMYPRIERPDAVRGRAVITGVQGEMHQMGVNIVADALEADGWDVRFLGTNMPHDGILRVIAEHRAGVLGISATMLFSVPQVRRLVRDRAAPPAPRIVLGGSAFRAAPDLWGELGAVGFAGDVRESVAHVRGWLRVLTQTIFQQADRMNGLVEQLLNVSPIEAGKLALDRRPVDLVDLVDLVEEAVATAQATTTRHRLALQAPPALAVEGDPLGLGLYITRQIVELHGGRIWIDAPKDGGTRFVVTLPALAEPLAPAL
jgi:signal transduction histidine kinase